MLDDEVVECKEDMIVGMGLIVRETGGEVSFLKTNPCDCLNEMC